MPAIIEVKGVSKRFGGFLAVNECSLSVEKGSVTGLIGPNGAGKSTLFNMVAGTFAPTSGQILLDGEDVTGLPAHALFRRRLLRTFQIAHEFSNMTVLENLMMVPDGQAGEGLAGAWFMPGRVAR
jgi:branched-chain amino acid transport system ATP-binding protein